MWSELLSSSWVAAVVACCVVATGAAQEPPELILTGGRIVTLAEDPASAEALAVRDGRVQAVGHATEIASLAGADTRVVELHGRTVIPGLIDSHLHAVRGGRFYNLELRWDGVPTLREALERVRVQAARTPPGQWVRVVGGWSPYQFAERRMPTAAELTAAAPHTPVFVLSLYSAALLNRAGVEALGLDAESVPPPGGAYRFVDGGAELLAVPHPQILYATVGRLPELSPSDQLNSTRQFYRELNRFGLTGAVDPGGGGHRFPDDYRATQTLAERGELPLRLSLFLFPQRAGEELDELARWTAELDLGPAAAHVAAHAYQLSGAGENLLWAAGDFENFLAPRPELPPDVEDQLGAAFETLVRERWPFRIHATYGESIEHVLDALEAVAARRPLDGLRWIVDHAETVRPEQLARIRRLGGGVAIQNRMAFAGEAFVERYGWEAASRAPPLRELLASGVPLGAGTDGTRVASYNPWLSLAWMVTGETVGGTPLYGADQRLSRLEALRLSTLGSAWIAGDELQRGSLEPGKFADLAVLSADYFGVADDAIRDIESLLTVVGGRVVYAAGPYAHLDPGAPEVSPAWSPVARFGGYRAAD